MRTFLIELQNRPDGITNTSINSYSTEAITRATFHQRVAAAITSTQFVSVYLEVIDQEGGILEQQFVVTQYVPPEPETETEE
jgi:hypothetical protein